MPEDTRDVIQIKLGSQVYRGDYMKDLEIQEGKMNELLKEQPSKYAFWSKMYALARMIYERKKHELAKFEAALYGSIRQEAELAGEKITEKTIDAKVQTDEERDKIVKDMINARMKMDTLSAIQQAFHLRTNMLMSLAANLREEWDSVLAIKEKELHEKRLKGKVKRG